MTLHNDQGINPRGRHNNRKYLWTQHRSTSTHKKNTNRHKGRNWQHTIIVGDFNTSLIAMDISSKQKINRKTQVINDTLDEMDLIDIFRTFYPNAEYTFLWSTWNFSRIDYILGHKSNLTKFKKIEIVSSTFSNYSTMRLDVNYKKKHKHKVIKQYVSK